MRLNSDNPAHLDSGNVLLRMEVASSSAGGYILWLKLVLETVG